MVHVIIKTAFACEANTFVDCMLVVKRGVSNEEIC